MITVDVDDDDVSEWMDDDIVSFHRRVRARRRVYQWSRRPEFQPCRCILTCISG
jgi:hypothetical protein